MRKFRRSAGTATTLAATAAAMLCFAPDASAYVSSVTIAGGGGSVDLGGGAYGTNCSYTVTVQGSAGETVWMYDSNSGASFSPQQFSLGASGTATTTWTPTATGTHYVQAWSYNGSQWATVQVGTGVDLGSACVAS